MVIFSLSAASPSISVFAAQPMAPSAEVVERMISIIVKIIPKTERKLAIKTFFGVGVGFIEFPSLDLSRTLK